MGKGVTVIKTELPLSCEKAQIILGKLNILEPGPETQVKASKTSSASGLQEQGI
jgi:hypothetical protein